MCVSRAERPVDDGALHADERRRGRQRGPGDVENDVPTDEDLRRAAVSAASGEPVQDEDRQVQSAPSADARRLQPRSARPTLAADGGRCRIRAQAGRDHLLPVDGRLQSHKVDRPARGNRRLCRQRYTAHNTFTLPQTLTDTFHLKFLLISDSFGETRRLRCHDRDRVVLIKVLFHTCRILSGKSSGKNED